MNERKEVEVLKLHKDGTDLYMQGKMKEATDKLEETIETHEKAAATFDEAISNKSLDSFISYTRSTLNMAAEAITTMESTSDDELIKSRQENGTFVNSFNPQFRMPALGKALQWLLFTPDNTRLPANIEELNQTLPIIRNEKDKIVRNTSGLRFIWIGHASCLVQIDNFMFLTDPVFSDQCGPTRIIGPKRFRPPALTITDLPDNLDAVVISHNHHDHLDYPSVRSLHERYGRQLTWFCGLGGREWFRKSSIENVIELDWWEEWQHPVSCN